MSIRRQSCDPCFKARRKCDLEYPSCKRCQTIGKRCNYVYPPQLSRADGDTGGAPGTVVRRPPAMSSSISSHRSSHSRKPNQARNRRTASFQMNDGNILHLDHPSIPTFLGYLGELAPVVASTNFTWVFDQIRACPINFARQAETFFIHKSLSRDGLPRPLRAAFGICAGVLSMNAKNQPFLFRAVEAEVSDLIIAPATPRTLREDLATLQAAVLYQIIRLFYGNLEQRATAEQQEYLVRSFALTLLQRIDVELRDNQASWEDWILAESIRRTVAIAFKLYTVFSTVKYGTCSEIAAICLLPMSTKGGSWNSRDAYLRYPSEDDTTTYADFSLMWDAAPHRSLDVYEKVLVIGCRGMDKYEALTGSQVIA